MATANLNLAFKKKMCTVTTDWVNGGHVTVP